MKRINTLGVFIATLTFTAQSYTGMQVVAFNMEIFEVLLRCGFRYCYSKTVNDDDAPEKVRIFLTPVWARPNIRKLPVSYDTYYSLTQEPKQMAAGIDGNTTVFINLNQTLLKQCYEQENIDH